MKSVLESALKDIMRKNFEDNLKWEIIKKRRQQAAKRGVGISKWAKVTPEMRKKAIQAVLKKRIDKLNLPSL